MGLVLGEAGCVALGEAGCVALGEACVAIATGCLLF